MPYTAKQKAAARTIQRAVRRRNVMDARKGRYRSRNPRMGKPKRPLAMQVHNFVERSGSDLLAINTEATAVGLFKHFEFQDIQQHSAYTTLFGLYKINKIVVEFRYKSIGGQGRTVDVAGSLPVNEINPILYFKVDHNDDDSDTLVNLKQSMTCKEHQFTNDKPNFSISLRPAVLIEDNNLKGATGVKHRPKWGMWLDSDETAIELYGLKAYCVASTGGSGTDAGQLEVTYKTYFSMKNND